MCTSMAMTRACATHACTRARKYARLHTSTFIHACANKEAHTLCLASTICVWPRASTQYASSSHGVCTCTCKRCRFKPHRRCSAWRCCTLPCKPTQSGGVRIVQRIQEELIIVSLTHTHAFRSSCMHAPTLTLALTPALATKQALTSMPTHVMTYTPTPSNSRESAIVRQVQNSRKLRQCLESCRTQHLELAERQNIRKILDGCCEQIAMYGRRTSGDFDATRRAKAWNGVSGATANVWSAPARPCRRSQPHRCRTRSPPTRRPPKSRSTMAAARDHLEIAVCGAPTSTGG